MHTTSNKVIAKDLIYNISAIVIMNVVIQFLVYPYLNSSMGEEAFGILLTLMSVVAILANSFGSAINNTRLVIKTKFEAANGDYTTLLLFCCAVSSVVGIIVLNSFSLLTPINALFFCALICMTLLRYYTEVNYRLTLNFKGYLFYYILLSIGYVVGVILYPATTNWYFVLILGEALAVVYVMSTGNIYKKPFVRSAHTKTVWRMALVVAGSYLISNFFLNMDRIVIQYILGGNAVTTFYTASLLGKTVALLVGPINGVMIAYLAHYSGNFTKKLFSKAVLLSLALSGICFVGCILVSPWLIRTFYPNVYDASKGLINIATLGQIVFFTSNLLLAVILRFCHEKHQFTTQLTYGVLYIALAIPLTLANGIYGFACATLISGLFRFGLVVAVGYWDIHKKGPPQLG